MGMIEKIKKYVQGRVVFLGIGNPVRGDDGVGSRFIEELKNRRQMISLSVHLFNGEKVPENYLEPIINVRPSTVFIVDAADFGAPAGTVELFEKVEPCVSFSTHSLPLNFIVDYLKERTKARVFILGIQPKQINWGDGLSFEVEREMKKLVDQFILLLH
ncbi:hydrogenase 3 maturation endopeptidase HyCI [Candidatus Aerophobetes bacterium]|nr:hydrogenase 3 maturation endopeptidase HyCI [Candidatus Aerophobetes bacterium]